jgi:hypothetical protein
VQTRDLVDLLHAQSMVNMMKNILNTNHDMQLSFKKTKIISAKNQLRKKMIKTESL